MEQMERRAIKGMVFAALFAALTAAVSPVKIPLGFTPVPITLQTLMVLLSGAMLGPGYGALSMVIYLLLGALGLPVFAGGGSGIASLFGPSGGYLFSYPIAAFAVGYLAKKNAVNNAVRYASFAVVQLLILIVSIDALFGLGILSFITKLSPAFRIVLVVVGFSLIFGILALLIYGKKNKAMSSDIILAMYAGTLIIYFLGAIQGKLVTGTPWPGIFIGWILPFIIGDTVKLLIAASIASSVKMGKYLK
ncbi:biotin transporter BioY [Candidatus Woesearchaeota archaeon]|nr:biotin transporter BioY [Candidatus Woesearchaeota archaeon]